MEMRVFANPGFGATILKALKDVQEARATIRMIDLSADELDRACSNHFETADEELEKAETAVKDLFEQMLKEDA